MPTDPPPLALATVDVSALDTCDGSAWATVAEQIDAACRTTGFFTVVGHGVPDDLRTDALRLAAELFALPGAAKEALRVACPPGIQRGYSGLGAEAQAAASGGETHPDLSESFAIGSPPVAEHGPYAADSVWPTIPGFEQTLRCYRLVMIALAERLLAACALALEGDAMAYAHLVTHPIGSTRANHYPASDASLVDGQWRGGAHTDYGTITVLATDGVPGLEIRTAEGDWVPVDAPEGGFVVNVGDLLARLSRGRWMSTWHRVTTPPGPPPYPARTSIAHFQMPNHDAEITGAPGEEPTTPGAYLTEKLGQLVGEGAP